MVISISIPRAHLQCLITICQFAAETRMASFMMGRSSSNYYEIQDQPATGRPPVRLVCPGQLESQSTN